MFLFLWQLFLHNMRSSSMIHWIFVKEHFRTFRFWIFWRHFRTWIFWRFRFLTQKKRLQAEAINAVAKRECRAWPRREVRSTGPTCDTGPGDATGPTGATGAATGATVPNIAKAIFRQSVEFFDLNKNETNPRFCNLKALTWFAVLWSCLVLFDCESWRICLILFKLSSHFSLCSWPTALFSWRFDITC